MSNANQEPEYVQIGPVRFQIVTDHNLCNKDGTRLDGHINYSLSEIRLDDDIGPQARKNMTKP